MALTTQPSSALPEEEISNSLHKCALLHSATENTASKALLFVGQRYESLPFVVTLKQHQIGIGLSLHGDE